MTKTIIADSDALIGLLNKNDNNSAKATDILEELIRQEVKLLYPVTTIAEATTTIQRKLSQPLLAPELIELIDTNELSIEPVDENILKEAIILFKPKGSKQNTLFDA